MTPHLVDPEGAELTRNDEGPVNSSRVYFTAQSIIPLIGIVATFAVMQFKTENNSHNIEKIQLVLDQRAAVDLANATRMATREDVQRLSDKFDAKFDQLADALRKGK